MEILKPKADAKKRNYTVPFWDIWIENLIIFCFASCKQLRSTKPKSQPTPALPTLHLCFKHCYPFSPHSSTSNKSKDEFQLNFQLNGVLLNTTTLYRYWRRHSNRNYFKLGKEGVKSPPVPSSVSIRPDTKQYNPGREAIHHLARDHLGFPNTSQKRKCAQNPFPIPNLM